MRKERGLGYLTLLKGTAGKTYMICEIRLEEEVKRRLENLGMTQYTKVLLLNKKASGTAVIKVRGTRFAIGKKFAAGIVVEEVDNER